MSLLRRTARRTPRKVGSNHVHGREASRKILYSVQNFCTSHIDAIDSKSDPCRILRFEFLKAFMLDENMASLYIEAEYKECSASIDNLL